MSVSNANISIPHDTWSAMNAVPPAEFLKTYLLNASSNDMTVDGSSTAVVFSYTVPASKELHVSRLMIYLEDSTAFSSILFGGITALTNGIDIKADTTTLVTWKDNADLATTMFDVEGRPNFGKDTMSLCGRWTFSKETGLPIVLKAGETFTATVNDALGDLDVLRLTIGGRLLSV